MNYSCRMWAAVLGIVCFFGNEDTRILRADDKLTADRLAALETDMKEVQKKLAELDNNKIAAAVVKLLKQQHDGTSGAANSRAKCETQPCGTQAACQTKPTCCPHRPTSVKQCQQACCTVCTPPYVQCVWVTCPYICCRGGRYYLTLEGRKRTGTEVVVADLRTEGSSEPSFQLLSSRSDCYRSDETIEQFTKTWEINPLRTGDQPTLALRTQPSFPIDQR